MTQADYLKKFEELVTGLVELTRRKNADYAGLTDAFQNFRVVEFLNTGVSVEQGIMVRMSDKFQRVVNLLQRPAQVQDESLTDTLRDLAVYSLILLIYLQNRESEETKLVYIASPYTAPTEVGMEARFQEVLKATNWLMRQGFVVFSPIAHAHPVAAVHELPREWSFWEKIDRIFIERCESFMVLTLPGWRESTGVTAETAIAAEQGKQPTYLVPEGDEYRISKTAP